MQVRKGDIVKKKKLMALLYVLILLILLFTIYLEVKELKNKSTKTVDELINEEINERYNNDKVDYYTFEEVNEQKYLDSSEENNSSDKKETTEQKGNNKTDKVIEAQSNKPATTNNNVVDKPTNNSEPKDEQPKEQVITETTEDPPKVEVVEDNSVDTNSIDYRIHKGRIDCGSAEALGSAGNEMKGINSGRNSYKGIYKSTITKASHGTIDKISAKTAYKSLAYLYLDNAPVAISLSEIHELFPFDTEDEKIISEYSPYYSIPELPKYDWDAPRMCELEPSK